MHVFNGCSVISKKRILSEEKCSYIINEWEKALWVFHMQQIFLTVMLVHSTNSVAKVTYQNKIEYLNHFSAKLIKLLFVWKRNVPSLVYISD